MHIHGHNDSGWQATVVFNLDDSYLHHMDWNWEMGPHLLTWITFDSDVDRLSRTL